MHQMIPAKTASRLFKKTAIPLMAFVFISVGVAKDVTGQLPASPQGFQWVALREIDGAVLQPKGWHFRRESPEPGTQAYFITKQPIHGKDGRFETGYSLNVVKGVKAKTGKTPAEYAAIFIEELKSKGKFKDEARRKINSFFEVFSLSLLLEDSEGKTILAYSVTANNATDTIYIAFFEAPLDKWPAEKKQGITILSNQAFEEKF